LVTSTIKTKFEGTEEGKYFEWRPAVIKCIQKANTSLNRKYLMLTRYGGQYRALSLVKKRLLNGTKLNIDNLKSVNEVRNQVLAFIDHCYAHDHTSYLDSDAFMEDINNKLMTEKLLTKLWTDHKIWNLKEPLTSIKVIAEWLNFAQSG
jgi:hypothetical protein